MSEFVFETTPRIVCQAGAAQGLGKLARELGVRRVMVVTDHGLLASGALDQALAALRAQLDQVSVFDGVQADPPEAVVLAAVAAARKASSDGVIGMGGGSSLDTAKLVALLAPSPQSLSDIYGIDLARGQRLPLIQVPTTAGTGSEVTSIAIVTTPSNEKMGVVSRQLYPDIAVLDSLLTLGLPPSATAMTGIDAMVHAIEAYTSRDKKNPVSDALAGRALTLLSRNIMQAVTNGADVAARTAMLQGSLLAGMAFANSPVGAVHALAYPLGGHFHVPHGLSNALVLVPVLHYNKPECARLYAELAPCVMTDTVSSDRDAAAEQFIKAMGELVIAMPMAKRLHEVGVSAEDLDQLATDAMKVTRLLRNNPREMTLAAARNIYASVL